MSGPFHVEFDPSFADWTPWCVVCGERIESWEDALGMPCSHLEDPSDEDGTVGFVHKKPCSGAAE